MAFLVFKRGALVPKYEQRFRPTVEISPGATAVHGITAADLKTEPLFEDCAEAVRDWFDEATCFVGYNVRFDLGVLNDEFKRVEVDELDLRGRRYIDPCVIWKQHERHTLDGAHKRFVGRPRTRAHNALADVEATMRVLPAMLDLVSLGRCQRRRPHAAIPRRSPRPSQHRFHYS
mmetsp:Transcript_19653/g.78213  ORF Transcript_19653/g.78213 Transcript_19653/m.78213 type:complete len:175 (+) Transcript_19653:497-1021(+)